MGDIWMIKEHINERNRFEMALDPYRLLFRTLKTEKNRLVFLT